MLVNNGWVYVFLNVLILSNFIEDQVLGQLLGQEFFKRGF